MDEDNSKAEVVLIAASPTDENVFAVGYADGSLRVWNMKSGNSSSGTLSLVFHGHKGSVTALAFDGTGTRLASGSKDTEIVVWDLVGEVGLFRMRGHSNAVTGLAFCASGTALISTSKDTLMKVWDLATQHCVETAVVHQGEITGMAAVKSRDRIVTVGADNKMRLFKVDEAQVAAKLTHGADDSVAVLDLVECVSRSSNERAIWAAFNDADRYLAVLGVDRSLELWKLRTAEEVASAKGAAPSWLKQVRHTRLQCRAKSVEFAPEWRVRSTASVKLLAGFADNQLGEVVVPLESTGELSIPAAIDGLGHRTECKAVVFNAAGTLLATAARSDVKIWNPETGAMVRTIEMAEGGEPTVLAFLTDDRGLLVGDASGMVHLVDLVTGEAIDSVKAHGGAVRALTVRPDRKGMMTGGADKNVKFWEFKATSKNDVGQKLKTIKTLQMNDEVLGLKYSPDLRYIAVATMDLTVKVFFEDSLCFYLSLYGHKLPVTGMDISADGKMLISCSADKNIKIWSLEFGECRKSIFGHADALTGISFIPGTSRFVTCSKDKTVKYWDAEKFTELQKLTGHLGEIWALGLNSAGNVIATVSKDRSVRLWRTSEEMLFPEEEKEREMEEQFEASMVEENPHERKAADDEAGRATTKTIASMKAGERIMECLEAADVERRKWDEYHAGIAQGLSMETPTPEPFFLALGKGKTPADFVLVALERIPLPEIEEALLCLPTNSLPSLLFYIKEWLTGRRNIVMSARVLDMVLRLFHRQIIANPGLRALLESIRDLERQTLVGLKDILGYNSVALQLA